jgi:hypothetical protein
MHVSLLNHKYNIFRLNITIYLSYKIIYMFWLIPCIAIIKLTTKTKIKYSQLHGFAISKLMGRPIYIYAAIEIKVKNFINVCLHKVVKKLKKLI